MRLVLAAAALSLAVVACSSSDDAAPSCKMLGTYSLTTTEEGGGTCGAGGKVTYTIRREGAGYWVEIPGFQAGCPLEEGDDCEGHGKCDVTITDASDPNDNVASIQFAWHFAEAGFSGSSVVTAPRAPSFPNGCRSTYAVNATRL